MKLLIFGGTTEGRVLAQRLSELGHDVTVSVATALGAEELAHLKAALRIGRLDAAAIEVLAADFQLVIDATHPYAAEVTRNIKAACLAQGIPLRRVLRGESQSTGCIRVESCAAAAELLSHREGNILVTTGAKELSAYAGLDPSRIFARVLPTHAGLEACEALGLAHRNILALQGPFTQQMNEAMLEQYHIRWLVTKDGGSAGGFQEKLDAARNVGAELILVCRPEDQGISMEALLKELSEGGTL